MPRKGEVSIFLRIRDGGQAAIANMKSRLTKFGGAITKTFKVVSGALAAVGVGVAGASAALLPFIVRSTMEFQKFAAQLRIFTGSAASANKTMEDLKRLAMELPFDLANITEAFITLRSGGVDPSEETIRKLGDIASGMGKDIGTLAQAVKNGLMGEMEMLKQFGISMLVEGDSLRASFGSTSKLIGRDAASILGFLEEIAEHEFAGASAERMATLEGAFSNLQDKAWNLAVTIGEKGGVADAIGELAGEVDVLLTKVLDNEDAVVKWTGVLIKSFKLVGSALWTALVVPWDVVVAGLTGTAALATRVVADALGWIKSITLAAAAVTGNTKLTAIGLGIDPTTMRDTANALTDDARAKLVAAGEQIAQLVQRGVDVAVGVALDGGRGKVDAGGRGLASTTTTPVGGPGGSGSGGTLSDGRKAGKFEGTAVTDEFTGARTAPMDLTLGRTKKPEALVNLDAINASVARTIGQLDVFDVTALSAMDRFAASAWLALKPIETLEEQLIRVGTQGLGDFTTGFADAFSHIREGWGAVGEAMAAATQNAVSQMAAAMSQYYALEAAASLAKGFAGDVKQFAAAAKFMAASVGFAALAGITARQAGGGGGGGRGGSGQNRQALDSVGGGPVIINLPNSGIINANDPRTQDEFRQMLEKLAGRRVEIRRR